ncbi:MAG: tyrosine-type recombinase/integrase [Candidatus Bathyarchaeia archaeon]
MNEVPAVSPTEKPIFTIEVETKPPCPECGSKRLYRDGLRYLTDGTAIQRYFCRVCGYRFSWPRVERQHRGKNLKTDAGLTLNECSSRALALLEPREGGHMSGQKENGQWAAGATELDKANIQGKILEFAWWLKKQGLKDATIENYVYKLKVLMANGADLTQPETVKDVLAKIQKSLSWKHLAVCSYTSFLKMLGLKWEPPTYKVTRKLPFIPTEQELDNLIACCNRRMAAFLQTLKESGMRAGEANTLEWADVDLERRIVTLNKPEKGGNARLFAISPKLAMMLGALPKNDKHVFGETSLKTKHRVFQLARQRAALKLGNPRLLRITFHTFRHWKATTEYHKTKDLLHVAQLLGHKSIDTTTLYIQIEKTLFQTENDEFHFATAKTINEAGKLIEAGFEYVCHHEGIMLFRKRK